MATSEAPDWIEQLLRERANRGFGDVQRVSDQARQPFSIAGMTAADNLLTKALRAIENGDEARAVGYVRRAVELPFDEHEESYPALVAAHMLLYTMVTDALEATPEGESAWLEAALDVLRSARLEAQCDLRDILTSLEREYELEGPERRALRASLPAVPPRPSAWDLRYPPEQQREMVTDVLNACAAYRHALSDRTEG
ncbi:MAG: hypothetical protein ACOYBY_16220 [Dermatophilaceae bacterium]